MLNEIVNEGKEFTSEIKIITECGLHCRPSGLIYNMAKKYTPHSYLTYIESPDDSKINTTTKYSCKSPMELITMGAPPNSIVKLHVEGNDNIAKEACRNLKELICLDLDHL